MSFLRPSSELLATALLSPVYARPTAYIANARPPDQEVENRVLPVDKRQFKRVMLPLFQGIGTVRE